MPGDRRTLFLRGDAGAGVGSGHVSRLLAIGEAWVRSGGRAKLLTSNPTVSLRQTARDMACELVELPPMLSEAADLDEMFRDAQATASGNWLVIDGYQFSPHYLSGLRARGARLLRIDDSPRGPVSCDALLDPTPGAEAAVPDVPPRAVVLPGARWAPLKAAFAKVSSSRRPCGRVPRVLVSFGGWDPCDATSFVLRGLLHLKRKVDVVVVVGSANPRAEAIAPLSAALGARLEMAADMPALMSWADLAIIGGGMTSLEACASGLPSLVATVADNQIPAAAALAARGAALGLGPAQALSEQNLLAGVERMLSDDGFRGGVARAGRDAVDGLGAERVVAALMALDRTRFAPCDVTLRPATQDDLVSVWRIANDPSVRAQSFLKDPISLDEYRLWYSRVLSDPAMRLSLLEAGGVVVGQIRYSQNGEGAEVHYSVHSAFRGKGLGTILLAASRELACRELKVPWLKGYVIEPNEPSMRSFSAAGWRRTGEVLRDGQRCSVFEALCS